MDDDKLFEEATSQELSKLNESTVDPETETSEAVIHEIPESVLSCFQMERDRLNSIERLLTEEPEEKSTVKDAILEGTPDNYDDFLKAMASELGEDVVALKKRVISEIEEEEAKSVLCTEDAQTASKGNTSELLPGNDEDSDEYVETERQFRTELKNLERRLKTEEEKRLAEHKVTKERLQKARREEEERRMRRHRFFEEELKRIEYDNMVQQHLELGSKDGKINGRISKELSKQQELITGLQKHMVEERQAFEEVQAEESRKTKEKQCRAATKIQACVRVFLVRTKTAMTLREKREERRLKKEALLRLEQERKEKEETIRKKLEELRIRREEDERRKEEERIRRKEEKKRQEEERIRQKEEKKRQEEERIRQEEKKREEVERLMLEETKRKEEEAMRKKEEEDQLEMECVQRREEEARKRKEEARKREEEARKREEEARKRKEEEIRKREELERQRRIEEEECQQREIEERKAEELRICEEELIRHQQKERSSTEESQDKEEVLIPGEKENPYCSSAESEEKMFPTSNSLSSSDGLERGRKHPESGDAISEGNQSEEEQGHWRLKCFYRSSRSSVSSSPDEMLVSVCSRDAMEAGQRQQEGITILSPDEAVAEDSERISSASLSDGTEQKCVEWVKDFAPWTKHSLQTKRRPVLKTTIVRRGSAKSLPPQVTHSVLQSASLDSHNELLDGQELNPGQLEDAEESSAQDGQRALTDLTETRAGDPAFLVCRETAVEQDDRRDEWRRNMEQQSQMEKEKKENKERAREKVLEQQRRKEEEERERCTAEEEERQQETEERKAKELGERGESETRREESQREKTELVPADGQLLRCSDVKAAEQADLVPDPQASSEEPPPAEGSCAGGSEPPEAGSRRPSSSLMCMPESAELKRLEWMKDCIPWTKLSLLNRRKQAACAKIARRASVKALPPLSADAILQSAAWNSLRQVTTVTLEDLPGCSLSTLSECTKLQALTLRRCGLLALDGLSGCRGLKHIDLQENEIKFVNCKDLSKLQVLILSQNHLTSIHGLEDAVNLDVLELSHNRISRLAGLESQKRLQRLLIDHNQLIGTRGLSELYTLLYLDCGHNHLTSMGDLENCALLSTLKLQGNNLTEPPSLKNHVLMKELYLDDNIVSSLDSLSVCWLPLLQLLSASKNSITHLPPMSDCVSLKKLDISHNCLSELVNVRHSLQGCSQLQEIDLSGNPFQQESNWRSALLQTVPGSRRVNGEWISSTALTSGRAGTPQGSFLGFCHAQLLQLERVQRRHEAQLSGPCLLDVPTIVSQHCEELLRLAEEHRNAHEFGDLTVTDRDEPLTPGPYPAGAAEESKRNAASGASYSQVTGGHHGAPSSVLQPSVITSGEDGGSQRTRLTSDQCTDPLRKQTKHNPSKKPSPKFDLKNMAAVVIQSFWRGHLCRRALVGRGDSVTTDRVSSEARLDQCRAATVIQAAWKGYILRKRLASALAAVRVGEVDEEFAEVDMDEFAFDEAALDRDWITLDSEHSPPKTLPSRGLPAWPKPPVHQFTQQTIPSVLPWQPRPAWPGGESERAALSGRGSVSPQRIELTHRTKSPLECVFGPPKEKSEKIMKEWGLRDRYTAQLMLKRAQKMKPKKKKDRRSGDPAAYLDLFMSGENKQAPVRVPKRSHLEKSLPFKDYFVAGEEDYDEEKRISNEWTDIWLQMQASNLDSDRTSPALESERFLPEIDVDILNGRRVQLVSVSALPRCCQAGPGLRDGPDQENGSRASAAAVSPPRKEHNQMRADATGHTKREAPAPVQAASAPSKKERISFRDNPVQLSLGWGGGKKRSTLRK